MDLPHSFVEGVREINVSIKKYIPTPEPSRYHTGGGTILGAYMRVTTDNSCPYLIFVR